MSAPLSACSRLLPSLQALQVLTPTQGAFPGHLWESTPPLALLRLFLPGSDQGCNKPWASPANPGCCPPSPPEPASGGLHTSLRVPAGPGTRLKGSRRSVNVLHHPRTMERLQPRTSPLTHLRSDPGEDMPTTEPETHTSPQAPPQTPSPLGRSHSRPHSSLTPDRELRTGVSCPDPLCAPRPVTRERRALLLTHHLNCCPHFLPESAA